MGDNLHLAGEQYDPRIVRHRKALGRAISKWERCLPNYGMQPGQVPVVPEWAKGHLLLRWEILSTAIEDYYGIISKVNIQYVDADENNRWIRSDTLTGNPHDNARIWLSDKDSNDPCSLAAICDSIGLSSHFFFSVMLTIARELQAANGNKKKIVQAGIRKLWQASLISLIELPTDTKAQKEKAGKHAGKPAGEKAA